MKSSIFFQPQRATAGFALISVLALVSLAAMTATAFLASARLEREATRPLSQTIQLEWALASGEKCAEQLIGDAFEPTAGAAKNFVTTLWRGTNATDYTNETGYLFIGEPNATNNVRWTYWAGFSTAGLTNFSTNVIGSAITFTNNHQGTFSNDCSIFMRTATNGFMTNPPLSNRVCTEIELLGGQTSPPVGWVYLTQRKRPAGSLTEVESPVARVAWFTEDLSGKIDAERMGGLSGSRLTGTNAEEICLTSLIRTNMSNIIPNISFLTNTNTRKLFFTPGILANSSISGLTNTADLRYFATGLREFRPTNLAGGTNGYLDWIPSGIPIVISGNSTNPYSMNGYTKANLNNFLALTPTSALTGITNLIRRNLPNFTNRAGGMNGTNYALALAANILDYADSDSSATITNIGTPTYATNVVGFDSYPFVTQLFDQIVCNQTGNNPPVLTLNTYLQFWNPSSVSSPAANYTLLYDFADTVATIVFTNATATNSNNINIRMFPTNSTYTNSVSGMGHSFSNDITVPALSTNQGSIVRFTRTYNITGTAPSGFVWSDFSRVWINGTSGSTQTNPFTIRQGTNDLIRPKTSFYRSAISLTNGEANWLGTIPGLRYGASAIGASGQSRLCADPRMLNYLTSNPSTNGSAVDYANAYWQGYPAEFTSALITGHPVNWPDGYNKSIATRGIRNPSTPPLGIFTIQDPLTLITDPAPCKISNFGAYTNICELGNIFDPIQWAPPATSTVTNYANVDISTATSWTRNSIYGGGSTLRIGRPEHSLFAFTNFGNSGNPIPNMGQSAAALLDLFCVTNGNNSGGPFRTGGKININTAPYPVLAALAGGITLTKDTNQVGSTVNTNMIQAFANGVMKFRHVYPFLTPSQLLFISVNYGNANWTNSAVWSNAAVFSTNQGLTGVTGINDEGLEEWFSKIYQLSTVSSDNYRVYIVAQLVDTNLMPTSPTLRKYVQFSGRPDTSTNGLIQNTSFGVDMYYWVLTKGLKKTHESPY